MQTIEAMYTIRGETEINRYIGKLIWVKPDKDCPGDIVFQYDDGEKYHDVSCEGIYIKYNS